MYVVVGSTNPVKIDASSEAFEMIHGEIEVDKCNVNSGVSDQPTTDEEAIEGARNRAIAVVETCSPDFAVGLEGSVADTKYGMFLTGWAYLLDDKGESYLGGGGRLKLPQSVAERIRDGEELGPIMDEIMGRSGIKEGKGAIGVFTDGAITRKTAYRNALIFALAKYLNPELYVRAK